MRLKNNFKIGQGEGIKGPAPLETIGQLVSPVRNYRITCKKKEVSNGVKRKRFLTGQATFEYFVLFVLLGFFCLFSLNRQQNIKNSVQRSAQDIFQRGVVEIVKMR